LILAGRPWGLTTRWVAATLLPLAVASLLFHMSYPPRVYAPEQSVHIYVRGISELRVAASVPSNLDWDPAHLKVRESGPWLATIPGPYLSLSLGAMQTGQFEYWVRYSSGTQTAADLTPILQDGQESARLSAIAECDGHEVSDNDLFVHGWAQSENGNGAMASVAFHSEQGFRHAAGDIDVIKLPDIMVPSRNYLGRNFMCWPPLQVNGGGWWDLDAATVSVDLGSVDLQDRITGGEIRSSGRHGNEALVFEDASTDLLGSDDVVVSAKYSVTNPDTQRRSALSTFVASGLLGVSATSLFMLPRRRRFLRPPTRRDVGGP